MSQPFCHLHIHSEYSIQDGIVRIDSLVEKIAESKAEAVAITDHCNLFAMVKFYQAAESAGIKPIIGVDAWLLNEVDETKPYRLILLCQNEQGYRNLTELVSRAYVEGQRQGKPLIHKEWIKAKNLGLIAIANSLESDVAEALLAQQQEIAENLCEYWVSVFGDRFYLEVTRCQREGENHYIQEVLRLAERKGYPLVASNAVRFLEKDDFEAHEARVCIYEGQTLNNPNRIKKYSEQQYLKTSEEMAALFFDLPEAIENSYEIVKRCNFELKLGQVFFPNFPVPPGNTIQEYFKLKAREGLAERFKHQPISSQYTERLETELQVLNDMGFAGYFLIVADFVRWAKENAVPVGPGRGSGAGSLVAYALQITGIDPLPYELLFERFLNPERVSLPDFDIDFCMEGRDRVIEYVANTYGRNSVSQIITYGTMAAKAVIRDVGRVLGMPYGFVDKIAKLIPLELGITLDKALQEEEALKQRYKEEEEVKTLIDLAKKLEGITRNAGKHAGGVVIAPSQLTDYSPLYCDSEGVLVTQFDKNDVETIGLVKFDFLGLRTLTIIDWALERVNEYRKTQGEKQLDIEQIPMQDEKTFDLLRSCQTTAVFQLESRGMKDLVRRLQPDNFEEIIALVALFRPGPLQSGMVEDFINRKHGRATPEYLHPKLTHILKPTYGIILYQEQVMQIAQILAGYTLGAADLLRRAMGKKKPEEMAKQRAIFTKGAIERGVEAETANYIFDLMEKFAGYGFNKSHSAAYALLTYQTAWLKAHYPAAFMAAVLSSDMAHTDKVVIFIEDCRSLKIPLLPPDVNRSAYQFTVNHKGEIEYGLGAIKGVGEAAIQSIIDARAQKPFVDIFDFCSRVDLRKVSRRVTEALIRSGSFDCFGKHRALLFDCLEDAIQSAEQRAKNKLKGQVDLFGDSLTEEDLGVVASSRKVPEWSKGEILVGEKETLGFYLSGHPLEQHERELKFLATPIRDLRAEKNRRISIAGMIVNSRTLLTRKGDRMAFLTIEDRTGRQEVAVFSDTYNEKRELLVKDNLVVIEGEVSFDEFSGGLKMRCMDLFNWDSACAKAAKYLKIELRADSFNEEFTEKLAWTLKSIQANPEKQEKQKPGLDTSIHGNNNGNNKGKQNANLTCPIRVFYERAGAKSVLKLGDEWQIEPSQIVLEKLRALEGCELVELQY